MNWFESLLTCSLRPAIPQGPGHCVWCGTAIVHPKIRWCGLDCQDAWRRLHDWSSCRAICLEAARDASGIPRCRHCRTGVAEEVNHIEPRNGQGYGTGCWNHQDNLEALCHACHVVVTTGQLRARLARQAESLPLGLA